MTDSTVFLITHILMESILDISQKDSAMANRMTAASSRSEIRALYSSELYQESIAAESGNSNNAMT